jgi:hypothetical protein
VGVLFGGMTSPLVVWLVTTAGGVLLFLFLLRRQQDDDESWSNGMILAAASAAPAVMSDQAPPHAADSPATTRPVGRATMLPPAPPRTFDKPPAKGVERARIGYRRVRISSKPDAVRSVELGRLDRGDEVDIIDSYEGFLQIRTPDGITGWILRHTIIGAPT